MQINSPSIIVMSAQCVTQSPSIVIIY